MLYSVGLMIDVKAMAGTITVNTLPILTPHSIIGTGEAGTTENLIPIEITEVRHAPILQIITGRPLKISLLNLFSWIKWVKGVYLI